MNGFQIGSKRLKVQHKRTGLDDEGGPPYMALAPSQQYAAGGYAQDQQGMLQEMHGSSIAAAAAYLPAGSLNDPQQTARGQRRPGSGGMMYASQPSIGMDGPNQYDMP
jgi:hypothetical protein